VRGEVRSERGSGGMRRETAATITDQALTMQCRVRESVSMVVMEVEVKMVVVVVVRQQVIKKPSHSQLPCDTRTGEKRSSPLWW